MLYFVLSAALLYTTCQNGLSDSECRTGHVNIRKVTHSMANTCHINKLSCKLAFVEIIAYIYKVIIQQQKRVL
jgi:hypothetical protein